VTFEDRYLQIKFFIKIILMAGRCLGEGGWWLVLKAFVLRAIFRF
jgi:hypothetical protein